MKIRILKVPKWHNDMVSQEAKRAKAAFEALSPEEQTALMQKAAQEEAMQQQAMQEQAVAQQQVQPSPEEVAIAEQQQADGSQAMVGQQPMMAEGGHLFKTGGYKWDEFWSPVNEYSKQKGNSKNKYKIDKTYKDDIKKLEDSEAYKAFTDYILNDATDEERKKYFEWIDANTGKENKYLDKEGNLIEGWQDAYKAARNDGLYGIQHYTPTFDPNLGNLTTEEAMAIANNFQADPNRVVGMSKIGQETPVVITEGEDGIGRKTIISTPIPRDAASEQPVVAPAPALQASDGEEEGVVPKHRAEWLRYAGLFGPAIGLGLMGAGVGKPDTGLLDAAVSNSGNVNLADAKYLGDYERYTPLDRQYYLNQLMANARATDRALTNTVSPSKAAGLLANGYNTTLSMGNLARQAEEYNDALYHRVKEFNRGTNQYNADAYNRLSQFNADALNRARQQKAGLTLQAAREKMDADAGWYNSLYGNISGLFKGIGDVGRENYQMNRIAEMAARGDFGSATDETYGFEDVLKKKGKKKACGGKMKKRGLTY